MAKYTHYKTIVAAAQALTGTKAKTKEGAWKALKEKHLPKFKNKGLVKHHYFCIPNTSFYCYESWTKDQYNKKAWEARADRGGERILRALKLKTRMENVIAGGSDEWEKALYNKKPLLKRDSYNALYSPTPSYTNDYMGLSRFEIEYINTLPDPLKSAKTCIHDVEHQGFDEHGGWLQYAEFDSKGRGSAVNVDVYGTDPINNLHVVQVRQFVKQYKNGFSNVKKSYFLIGYNENGNPFAHPVSAHAIHAAIKKDPSPEGPVKAAQAWIWNIKVDQLSSVIRNGDVAMIPIKTVPKKDVELKSGMMQIIDSHYVYAKEIRINGNIYAINPTVRHLKSQHPTVKGKGWFKIVIGTRANHHDFARPTVD
jgi:hypothetical protein